MLNAELFVENPAENEIPNTGVAKVGEPGDDSGWSVLRYELTSFVCDGEYERGLDRILSSYVARVGSEQPAAWVSGFYGSGKSHLVRVLQYLWSDRSLPDGATPRGLVRVTKPVETALLALSTIGKRQGGLWSAAGTLGAGSGSVRLGFLSILLSAADLPEQLAQAQCVMWLLEEGLLETVKADIASHGLVWTLELDNMYVSHLAEAILAARPGWAASAAQARSQIHAQFPEREDITLQDTMKMVDKVLRSVSDKVGKLPCALVVLDEMQQFINENPERAQQVQLLVEACSKAFGGQLLIVATGQAALQTTANLQKLIDRFGVQIQLSDADVDSVIRQVVLRKRPDRVVKLQSALDSVAGEIDRHLAGSRIAPNPADQPDLVLDYPLLPARRRFWEEVLRAVDKAGKGGQLRTQLKVVHDAASHVAGENLGSVVAADFIYSRQEAGMVQSGVLLREIEQLIAQEAKEGKEGPLRSRVLSLVFLISQLSREGFADTGVRATATHIADLLISDLNGSADQMHRDVERLLEELRSEAKLQRVEDEYQLQTRAGQEWTKDFRARQQAFLSAPDRIAAARDSRLRAAAAKLVPSSVVQGTSKTARQVSIHFGDSHPIVGESVVVWVRNGWDITEKQFGDLALGDGVTSPVVFVYFPKLEADALRDALSEAEAGTETLDTRAMPTTDEGRSARAAMQSTAALAGKRADAIIELIVANSRIAQAGATQRAEPDLAKALGSAIGKSLDRLFGRFTEGDSGAWGTVFARAQSGDSNCLEAIGYKDGGVLEQPVCNAVYGAIASSGTSGIDLRKKFEGSPYGWPRDAVHGAVAALLVAGSISAQENGLEISAKELTSPKFGKINFRPETKSVSMATRLAVRQVLIEAGVQAQPGEDAAGCSELRTKLTDLAVAAGGPPPLPPVPTSSVLDALKAFQGNELILAVFDSRDDLRSLVSSWKRRVDLHAPRLADFALAKRLASQLSNHAQAAEAVEQLDAVESTRSLLDDHNPVAPLVTTLADLLRDAVRSQINRYAAALDSALAVLDGDGLWNKLSVDQRGELLDELGLTETHVPSLGTPREVLAAVEARPLLSWDDRVDAVTGRVAQAIEGAARLLEPTAVKIYLPGATIKSDVDLTTYVDMLRKALADALAEHGSIII